jgi:tetratricopeptide (TPR) repeat protein
MKMDFKFMISELRKLPKRNLSYYEPGRNEPCLCGSGLKFKKCCLGRYSGEDAGKAWELYNIGHYEEALMCSRRHLTWYILSHKGHTVPLLEAKAPPAEELLKVDIEALDDIITNLHRCYYRTKRSEQFPATINKLSGVITDKRWSDKVNYFHALWYLTDENDREGAFMALDPIVIEDCHDPEILTLYLDVCPDKTSFAEKIILIDRIINNTHKEAYKLQYTTLKGIQYFLVCEMKEALVILRQGVDRYRRLEDKYKSAYGDTHFAHALDLLGKFANDQKIIEEAIDKFTSLIDSATENSYPPEYIGDLLKSLGESNETLGRHEVAIEKLEESLNVYPVDITRVFLSRSMINNGMVEDARQVLDTINYRDFDEACFFDFAISWTLLAANTCTEEDLGKAKQYLRESQNDHPVFIQQRDKWLINLLEIDPVRKGGIARRLALSINKYVTLNPNFFGIGIDFNKIVDDIDRNLSRR